MKEIWLPEEIVVGILSNLPVKSVVRFRSVCKSWYGFTRNPYFITKHLLIFNRTRSDNIRFLVTKTKYSKRKRKVWLTLHSGKTLKSCGVVDSFQSFRFEKGRDYIPFLLGPCNGIYCVFPTRFDNDAITLINPSLKESRTLPRSSPTVRSLAAFGFGFDSKINDFKVVRIGRIEPMSYTVPLPLHAEVLTSNSKSWKLVDTTVPVTTFSCWSRPVFVESLLGVCHWFVRYDFWGELIIGYHIADEVFDKRRTPNTTELGDALPNISLLNDSLVYVKQQCSRSSIPVYHIWKTSRYDVDDLWTKLYILRPDISYLGDLGYVNGYLYLGSSKCMLVSDANSAKPKTIQVLDNFGGLRSVHNYMESLISIKKGRKLKCLY